MRNAFLAAVAAATLAASLPAFALAQAPIVHLPDRAAMRPGVSAQLTELSGRIDRYVAQGRLSAADADHARREINRFQGEASDERERNGGQRAIADRFELQSQIDKFREDLLRERASGPSAR